MKKMITISAASLLLLLSGCTEPIDDIRPVSWFLEPANKEALLSVYEFCADNPGLVKVKPNCESVESALKQLCIQEQEATRTARNNEKIKTGVADFKKQEEIDKKYVPSCVKYRKLMLHRK